MFLTLFCVIHVAGEWISRCDEGYQCFSDSLHRIHFSFASLPKTDAEVQFHTLLM